MIIKKKQIKIKDWENHVLNKYKAQKIDDIIQLNAFSKSQKSFSNFTIEKLTENEMGDYEFYCAYVFDESIICKRKVIINKKADWDRMIIFIGSKDGVKIFNYSIIVSGELTTEELNAFINDIFH